MAKDNEEKASVNTALEVLVSTILGAHVLALQLKAPTPKLEKQKKEFFAACEKIYKAFIKPEMLQAVLEKTGKVAPESGQTDGKESSPTSH